MQLRADTADQQQSYKLTVAETWNSSAQQAKPPTAFRVKGMAKRQIMREGANERGDNATAGRRKTLVKKSAPKSGRVQLRERRMQRKKDLLETYYTDRESKNIIISFVYIFISVMDSFSHCCFYAGQKKTEARLNLQKHRETGENHSTGLNPGAVCEKTGLTTKPPRQKNKKINKDLAVNVVSE